MKIYMVFEDVEEANEYQFERLFIEAYFYEIDAIKRVGEEVRGWKNVYYEEVEVK